jgi:NAD-dependent dihydropyrimidine dehydrogenase PreA subunit
MLKIGHEVIHHGRNYGDLEVTIPVVEELETVPGIPINEREVDWYAREYPLEDMAITERVGADWTRSMRRDREEMREVSRESDKIAIPLREAGLKSGGLEPTGEPNGEDVSQLIKDKALQLGFTEAGITAYDHRYSYHSKKSLPMYPHALCLAYPQDFEMTQKIPGPFGEIAQGTAGRLRSSAGLELGEYIRSLGYHAQVMTENPGAVISMFVAAGVGQLGACGYLLAPNVGGACRLLIVTTDAKVTHDKPVDYGIHAFCQTCQICVNRCPGRALMRDKIWWRGIEKNKLYYKRCRPVMARYYGCGVCMRVCPIQKYGMKNVMDHYAVTGQVLGKGTHDLEGYSLEGRGYFGPGELPTMNYAFFNDMPRGDTDDWAFGQFKAKAKENGGVITDEMLGEFKEEMNRFLNQDSDDPVMSLDPSDL